MSNQRLLSSLQILERDFVRLLESKITFVLVAALFRGFLEIGYWVYVNPFYDYSGFVWKPDTVKYVESWLVYIVLVYFAPHRLIRPSDFFVVTLLFGLMAPLLSFYGLADQSRPHLFIVLLGYFLIDFFRRGRPLRFFLLREGFAVAVTMVGLGVVGVTVWFIVSGGFAFFNLDFTKVYEYRSAVGAVINNGLMGYINVWAWKVFGPTLLAITLWRKAYWFAAAIIGLHVLWFGVSAHKSVLFYPLLVIFLWLWLRRTRALAVIPLGLAGVIVLALVLFWLFDFSLASSLFIRRLFYVIANNTFDYYEFFSAHPLVWWSNSSITFGLLDYPYNVNPAEVIGRWRGTGAHVNNGFLSTGFMHAGVIGVILYGIIVGLLFRLIDSFSYRGIPMWVALSVLIVPSRSLLLNTDLPTSILTQGIGVGMVILFLMRKSSCRGSVAGIDMHEEKPSFTILWR